MCCILVSNYQSINKPIFSIYFILVFFIIIQLYDIDNRQYFCTNPLKYVFRFLFLKIEEKSYKIYFEI